MSGWVAGAVVVGSVIQSRAASRAADARSAAADRGTDVQWRMFERFNELQAPWREVGEQALHEQALLMGLPGLEGGDALSQPEILRKLQDTPGYQFAVEEGQRGIERSAAARGILGSGRTLKDLERFRQGMAEQQFGRRLAQLGALAGTGQMSVSETGQAGLATGANVASLQQYAGNAAAAGHIRQANIAGNAINQGMGLYAMSNYNTVPYTVPGDAYMPAYATR